jgi:hypothetical protein
MGFRNHLKPFCKTKFFSIIRLQINADEAIDRLETICHSLALVFSHIACEGCTRHAAGWAARRAVRAPAFNDVRPVCAHRKRTTKKAHFRLERRFFSISIRPASEEGFFRW